MTRKNLLSLVLCGFLLLTLAVPGVYAVWQYFDPPDPVDADVTATMGQWSYALYTITYAYINENNEEILLDEVIEVFDNSAAVSTENPAAQAEAVTQAGGSYAFAYWMNAGSTRMDKIPAGNTENIVLYPSFVGIYTAMFVDQDGNILASGTYTKNDYSNISSMSASAEAALNETLDADLSFDYWEVRVTKNGQTTKTKLSEYTFADDVDVTIYPVCTYNGDVNLIPVDTDGDGDTDHYQVGGYSNDEGVDMVEIPGEVNGIPVISVNADAFASYPHLHCVTIPKSVTSLGDYAFASERSWSGDSGETQTLYYEGSYQEWLDNMSYTEKAFNGLSEDTRIFFLNGGDKVDPSQGYLQVESTNEGNFFRPSFVSSLSTPNTITQDLINEMYTEICNCNNVDHSQTNESGDNRRPDYIYWGKANGSEAITIT